MKRSVHLFAAATAILLATAITGEATTRYVAPGGGNTPPYTNWTQAATTIQAAVNLSLNGDTVLVSNGTYTISSQIVVTNSVTIQSVNGSLTTIVNGNYPTSLTRCFTVNNSGAILDGFTITNGYGNTGQRGAGLVINAGVVRNCTISGNHGENNNRGGGLLMTGGTLLDCIVSGNSHSLYGGGIEMSGGLVDRCVITHNSGSEGGGLRMTGGELRNSVVANNTGAVGGGIRLYDPGTVANCVVYSNYASVNSGGVYFYGNFGKFINSIAISNASPDEANLGGYGRSNVSFTCTTPLAGGIGNIDADPQFLNPAIGDFTLLPTSPCINAGTNLPWVTTSLDLAGRGRLVGSAVDMGAYEYGMEVGIRVAAVDITWDAIIGRTYQPQWTTNLMGSWSNLAGSVVATSTFMYVYDWIRDNPNRSYRVIDITP